MKQIVSLIIRYIILILFLAIIGLIIGITASIIPITVISLLYLTEHITVPISDIIMIIQYWCIITMIVSIIIGLLSDRVEW